MDLLGELLVRLGACVQDLQEVEKYYQIRGALGEIMGVRALDEEGIARELRAARGFVDAAIVRVHEAERFAAWEDCRREANE
jgi:hypothetical protein